MKIRYCAQALVQDSPYLSGGGMTERGIEVFTQGECWLLAWTLHQMTGWEPIVIADSNIGEWLHILVRTPQGLYLDVTGLSTAEQISVGWKVSPAHLHGLDSLIDEGYADLGDFLGEEGPTHPEEMSHEMIQRTTEVAHHLLSLVPVLT